MSLVLSTENILEPLLAPILEGPEATYVENGLRELFGTGATEHGSEVTLDDLLGKKKACVLCITPRSGSTFLCTLMRSTGQFGLGSEFMNFEDIRAILKQQPFSSVPAYLEHIIARYSSPAGIFTIKGDLYQYLPLIRRGLIRKGLQRVVFIYVTRQDVLAQAVSAFRAIRTGQWSSLRPVGKPAAFEGEAIREQLEALTRMMSRWELLFALLGIAPIRITYEQIVAQPAQVLQRLGEPLGLTVGPHEESTLRQQRDGLSAEWGERLRRAAADYVASLWLEQKPGVSRGEFEARTPRERRG